MEEVSFEELTRAVRVPLELNVRPGEEVLILTDVTVDQAVPGAVAAVALAIGAKPWTLTLSARPAPNQEQSPAIASAMKNVNIIVNTLSEPIVHSAAARAAMAAGVIVIGMPTATPRTLTRGGATADPREVFAITERVASLLTGASEARVTSAQGTDVTMDLRGRKATILAGLRVPGTTVVPIPNGEAPIAPVEGSIEGTIVFDTTMNPVGLLSQPVALRVEKGRIVAIEGGPEAETLRQLLATRGDDNSYLIGEFAIGTNPKAQAIGKIEDKFILGSVHFGLGDNVFLGGTIRAAIHLDGVIRKPTVILDGRAVVVEGNLAP